MQLSLNSDDFYKNTFKDTKPSSLIDMTELRRLKVREPSPQTNFDKDIITFIEIPIESTDTLQGLSLKFGCSISQIKRLNNFAIDRDLYALTIVKIPIIEYSTQWALYEKDIKRVHINDLFLLNTKIQSNELEEKDKEIYANSDNDDNIINEEGDDVLKPLIGNSSIDSSSNQQKREAILFFKNIDKDSETQVNNQQKILLETIPSPIQLISDLNRNAIIHPDVSWCNFKEILIIAFIGLFIIPGIVYVYMRILNNIV
jgi:LysM repeat protein